MLNNERGHLLFVPLSQDIFEDRPLQYGWKRGRQSRRRRPSLRRATDVLVVDVQCMFSRLRLAAEVVRRRCRINPPLHHPVSIILRELAVSASNPC